MSDRRTRADIECALGYLRADRDQGLEHTNGDADRLDRVISLLEREIVYRSRTTIGMRRLRQARGGIIGARS